MAWVRLFWDDGSRDEHGVSDEKRRVPELCARCDGVEDVAGVDALRSGLIAMEAGTGARRDAYLGIT